MIKRIAKLFAFFVLLSTISLAASETISLVLSSRDNTKTQIEKLERFIAGLDKKGRTEFIGILQEIIDRYNPINNQQSGQQTEAEFNKREKTEYIVYIPKKGKKYHSSSKCSGMKNPRQVTVKEAKEKGYKPCSKCVVKLRGR